MPDAAGTSPGVRGLDLDLVHAVSRGPSCSSYAPPVDQLKPHGSATWPPNFKLASLFCLARNLSFMVACIGSDNFASAFPFISFFACKGPALWYLMLLCISDRSHESSDSRRCTSSSSLSPSNVLIPQDLPLFKRPSLVSGDKDENETKRGTRCIA